MLYSSENKVGLFFERRYAKKPQKILDILNYYTIKSGKNATKTTDKTAICPQN